MSDAVTNDRSSIAIHVLSMVFRSAFATAALVGFATVFPGPTNFAFAADVDASSSDVMSTTSTPMADTIEPAETPFDYDPYRVLVWWIADDPTFSADVVRANLRGTLARDFHSLWRTTIDDAPASVATLARRDFASLSYETMTAADPVFAIHRDHPEAVRLRTFGNVVEFVAKIHAADWRSDALIAAMNRLEMPSAKSLQSKFVATAGSPTDVWSDDKTEAILTSRGVAESLDEPEAKIIDAPAGDLIAERIEQFDKIFIVRVTTRSVRPEVTVVELDRLMRHFGAPTTEPLGEIGVSRIDVVASAIRNTFRPVVRIENAGTKNATGLVRGGGLLVGKDHPGRIKTGDILEPMLRKEDRNGNPFVVGPLDWSFLIATEAGDRIVKMDYWSGRSGSLQGRKNNRTYRMALRVRPRGRGSELRLHAKGDEDQSLVGYEIYEKNLETDEMSFVGRTDWRGTLQIEPSDGPFRLLYVKNGGAVLARLPIVPGLHEQDVANLIGDDDRLQAEAYVRGVQNSIIDLVAVRELYKARIMMRLERGEMDKAQELMVALREQPTSRELNDAIGKRKVAFLKSITNPSQKQKVDNMFSTTQDLLSKFINPKLMQDLETALIAAQKGKPIPSTEPAKEKDDA